MKNQNETIGKIDNGFGEDILFPTLSPAIICNSLTPNEVKDIVIDLGADKCEETASYFIFPTICHNPIGTESSMKLYYYFDRKIFFCYTECHEAFNLFSLIVRVRTVNGHEDTAISDAFELLLSRHCTISPTEETYVSALQRYEKCIGEQVQPAYSDNVLLSFSAYQPVEWLREDISNQTLQKFEILFSTQLKAIVIPHRDVRGRLIGIRGRFLDYTKDGHLPKYMPLKIENQIYSHQLSFNLYGLYQNLSAIQRSKKAIIFESEKSVLKHHSMYGEDSFAVACCGSNINKTQIDLLIKYGKIQELVIGLDREYDDPFSLEGQQYFKKLYELGQKYNAYMNISMIFDFHHIIDIKDAPIDRGKSIFETLYRERIRIEG